MNEKSLEKSPALAQALSFVKKYSFVLVFLAIFLVYSIANGGLTLNATMNILRHSAVIGTIADRHGHRGASPADSSLSVGSMLALVAGFLRRGLQHDRFPSCSRWSSPWCSVRCAVW